jgi:glycerol 3-phosphatase-2
MKAPALRVSFYIYGMEDLEIEIYRAYAKQLPIVPRTPIEASITTLPALCEHFDAFLFDGFGTLYNLRDPHPGSAQALQYLRKQGKEIRLITNAASRPIEKLQHHLEGMGIHFELHEIISSGDLLASENERLGIRSAYHLGRSEADPFLENAQITIMEYPHEPTVILTSALSNLPQALAILRQPHSRLVVLNPDAWAPNMDGTRIPVSGVAAWKLQKETGCELICLGKPFPQIFQTAIQSLKAAPTRTIMIGDTLGTDIQGAQSAGLKAALILGGNTVQDQIKSDEHALGVTPDYYLEHI